MKVIELENICKDFKVSKKKKFSDYFKFKKKEVVEAVSNVNLCVEKGEFIGLIGLNGAGKSTLIKMMTGILLPTSGEIKVLGNHPFYDRLKNNRKISTVFGQRCKLRWDISPLES